MLSPDIVWCQNISPTWMASKGKRIRVANEKEQAWMLKPELLTLPSITACRDHP